MIRPPRITFPVAACHGCGDATEHRYHTGTPCCDECQRACDASLDHCDAASHGTDCNACATWRRVIGVDLRAEPAVGADDGELMELDALYSARAVNDRDAHEHQHACTDDVALVCSREPEQDVDAFNPCVVAVARSSAPDYSPLPGHVPPMRPRLRLIPGNGDGYRRRESGVVQRVTGVL